jgi:outer membrane protein
MKNLSLILNIVLLVAVGVLYYFHFSSGKTVQTGFESTVKPGDLQIAYINTDSVLKYYDYLKASRQQLEEKTKKMDQDYRNRAQGLQNEFTAYQRNVNSMTLGQVRAAEEDLTKKQQNLQLYQQTLAQQVMEEENRINRELYQRVTDFLNTYGKNNGLQVVLKYDPTSDVLHVSDALDITQDVIKGLNDSYQTEKGKPAVKGDSSSVKKK